ncbi:uncharacterized protein LOC116765982 [Danaus plexippus]|nr:uncharacterized protein LOC116765982 [Danaus plexippus]
MTAFFYMAIATFISATACLPMSHPYSNSDQMEHLNPLDYYLRNQDASNFYQPQQQDASNGSPARLETLEPDSEVELIPGAQPPQQPPQQVPVSPNVPGLMPGQRVFIVHMPVPGLRPGSIGGYQPVYIVGAAPQGNNAYPGNGYQSTLLLGPQVINYPQAQASPNYVFGVPGSGPYVAYQNPGLYQQIQPAQGSPSLRLAQLISLQDQTQPIVVGSNAPKAELKSQANAEVKEPAAENQNSSQKSQS